MTRSKITPFFIFFLLLLIHLSGRFDSLFAYDVIPVVNGGELHGTVTFTGPLPKFEPIKVMLNPEYCGNTIYDESFMVNPKNKGLENVVVSIEGIERGKKANDEPLVVQNLKCHFVPHIQAGMVGNFLEIRNLDPVLHNNHFRINERTLLNMAMPPNGRNIKKPMAEAGIITTVCDAHTFMKGAIYVANNPYFAVTDKDGNYSISDIPPGKYLVKIWHEASAPQEKEIVIAPHQKVELSLEWGAR